MYMYLYCTVCNSTKVCMCMAMLHDDIVHNCTKKFGVRFLYLGFTCSVTVASLATALLLDHHHHHNYLAESSELDAALS